MEQGRTVAIRNVHEAGFEAEVVQASHTKPVVVDFWAAWCGPCHQLSPILERVAERHAGDVDLVKVDVDASPGLAQRYGVQGIPSVKAFRDGKVVAEFTGVQPEQQVDRFFAAVAPSEADRLVSQAVGATSLEGKEQLLRDALAADPGHVAALVGLAGIVAERGETEKALALLAKAPPADPEVRRMTAQLKLAVEDAGDDLDDVRQAAEAGDPDAQLRLGSGLAARGDYEEALGVLLAAVRHPTTREAARERVLEIFALLGDDHALVRTWRPKLAAALF